jgi:hypothetical protein
MNTTSLPAPQNYRDATRTLLRFAIVMAIVGLLSGIAYQESAKKLPFDGLDPGLRIQATIHLALVHGHIFLTSMLLPIALAGMLFLAVKTGGRPLGTRSLRLLTRGFLPFTAATVVFMLVKGYHFLLQVRGGARDLAAVDAAFLGGSTAARYAVYGFVHAGMGITLGIFLVILWRSLKRDTGDSAGAQGSS